MAQLKSIPAADLELLRKSDTPTICDGQAFLLITLKNVLARTCDTHQTHLLGMGMTPSQCGGGS